MIQVHVKTGDLKDVAPFIYARCMQTIFPIDGRPEPRTPGSVIEYTVPDFYGRPWAEIWEKHFETDMKRPARGPTFEFQ